MKTKQFPWRSQLCIMHYALSILMLSALSMSVTSCFREDNSVVKPLKTKSIVILYENDVHCGIDGYTKLRGLRDAIVQSDTSYVAMVSSGDFLQGALAGAISHGQYVVDIMKNMGYDAITLGNHEFDYGVPRMMELLPQIKAPVVSTNFFEYGSVTPMFPGYVIKRYGDKRIAFVGTTTPETMRSEGYSFFDNNGNQLYDLRTDHVYQLVQAAVDQARQEGANYVVVLSHLGEAANDTGIDSHGLVAATRGIDAVLDGHTHAVIPCDWVNNLDGKPVPVSQTGTQFANYGKLWVAKDGSFHTSLIADADNPYANARITFTTDSVKALMEQVTSRQIASVTFDLLVKDANSVWFVRKEEAPMGDLVADAFRHVMTADIGLINGGGLRNDILTGTINFGHVISVQPFDNHMALIAATGTQIMAMLQKCTEKCPELDGSFPQVSGMKYTIHTVTHAVTDVEVLNRETGNYEPLDLEKEYTIGTTDYYGTGGFYRTLQDCRLLENSTQLSRDALADYLENALNGVVPDIYQQSQGRITIVN